jgi:hypothetical protein
MKHTKSNVNKKVLASMSMLMVSVFMLSSATYAWFTMNKQVEVTGMEVKTKVGDNLLICTTNLDADYSSEVLSQTRKALLEPVSSINGATASFWYTTDAKANGDAVSDDYLAYSEEGAGATSNADAKAGKNAYMTAFQTAYGQTVDTSGDFGIAYGYVDYVFYIKATSSAANQKVVMSACDLDYDAGALSTSGTVGKVNGPDRAWRVAVFAKDITATNPGTGIIQTEQLASSSIATAANQKGLIALADAVNQTPGQAVNAANSAAGTVVNNAATNGVVIDTIAAANATKYYKVVVRLWLEGEDTTCTSETYAALTSAYKLDMQYKIVDNADTTTAVKAITNNGFTVSSGTQQTGNQYDTGA